MQKRGQNTFEWRGVDRRQIDDTSSTWDQIHLGCRSDFNRVKPGQIFLCLTSLNYEKICYHGNGIEKRGSAQHGNNIAFAYVQNGERSSSSSFQKRDSFKTPFNPFSELFIQPIAFILTLFEFFSLSLSINFIEEYQRETGSRECGKGEFI